MFCDFPIYITSCEIYFESLKKDFIPKAHKCQCMQLSLKCYLNYIGVLWNKIMDKNNVVMIDSAL